MSSSILAPSAVTNVAKGYFAWHGYLMDIRFRIIRLDILGVFFSVIEYTPIQILKFAQIANGILLMKMAILLF